MRRLDLQELEDRRLLAGFGFQRHDLNPIEAPLAVEPELADLDGDGDLDLLRAGFGISWSMNEDGQGNFGDPQLIDGVPEEVEDVTADEWYRIAELAPVDLDLDGDVDIVSSRHNGEVMWYENADGQGRFAARHLVYDEPPEALFLQPQLEVGDLDGDNDVDLVSLSGGNIIWLRNRGGDDLQFDHQVLQTSVNSVDLVDLDGDADLDLIYTPRHQGTIGWLENSGQGEFLDHSLPFELRRGFVVAGDADGDGDQDFAVGGSWFENHEGQFREVDFAYPGEDPWELPRPTPILSLDANGDGRQELFTKLFGFNAEDQRFGLFTFQEGTYTLVSTFGRADIAGLAAGDIDGDGDADPIAAFSGVHLDEPPVQAYMASFENQGGLNIVHQPEMVAVISFLEQRTLLFDAENDGDLDLLTISHRDYDAAARHRVSWYENLDGKGSLSEERILHLSCPWCSGATVDTADVDNDGLTDIVASQSRVGWFPNDGEGFLGWRSLGFAGQIIEALDFDGDTDVDILVNDRGRIAILENTDGKGDFNKRTLRDRGRLVAIADLDGDRDPDLLLRVNEKVLWLENDGAGAIGAEHHLDFLDNAYPRTSNAADINGDGTNDLILTVYSHDDQAELRWYPNRGDGTFENKVVGGMVTDALDRDVQAVDLDGDGDLDLFTSLENYTREQTPVWFENTDGRGQLARREFFARVQEVSASFGDIDGDSDLDFIGVGAWFERRAIGDVNNDGIFNSNDLVQLWQAGKYEDAFSNNASFDEGDWNADGDFTSADLVLALGLGTYQSDADESQSDGS